MKKLLKISSVAAILVGVILIVGGIWGICFTYQNTAREKIVTPADAAIPEQLVRGPFTLKAQADAIRKHTLELTGGKTYAEMPRQIPKLDEHGQPVLGKDGSPVMVTNTARDIWITATTLTTALNLGILAYAFSALIVVLGCIFIWIGVVCGVLSKSDKFN
jgi:hypothetical protein